jgi:hypothetical protein
LGWGALQRWIDGRRRTASGGGRGGISGGGRGGISGGGGELGREREMVVKVRGVEGGTGIVL